MCPPCPKRNYIVKFEGCYHGHADSLLVKAGSGVATLGIPALQVCRGIHAVHSRAAYNDPDALEEAFRKFKHQIACVIVEPVVGNMGCVPPARGYLEALRAVTSKDGAVLIFDEVMTGFRVAFAEPRSVHPPARPDHDGKIIGGGLPVGAYGGPSVIMDLWRRSARCTRPERFRGTAGDGRRLRAAALSQGAPGHLRAARHAQRPVGGGGAAAAKAAAVPMTHNRVGSMFTWFFTPGPVTDWNSASKSDTEAFGRFFRNMLEGGIYLPVTIRSASERGSHRAGCSKDHRCGEHAFEMVAA